MRALACAHLATNTRLAASISNPQWKRAREMVADIGHRYISQGAKGSALEHKKIGRLIANGDRRPLPTDPRATPHHRSPLPIYGAFCTFDIFYCRSPLFVLFMFLLGATRPPAVTPRQPWLGRRPLRKYLVHSRAKFTPHPLVLSPTSFHGRPLDITGGFAPDANAPLY